MDGVRQRRHVADVDGSGDLSEVSRGEDKDANLLFSQLTEDPSIGLLSVEKDKNKQSSISAKDRRSVEQLDDESKKQFEQSADEETLWVIALEVFLPFVVAGLGMSTTGITLNYVKVRALILFSVVSLLMVIYYKQMALLYTTNTETDYCASVCVLFNVIHN